MRPCPEYLGVSFTSEEKNGAAYNADSVVVKKVVSLKAKIPIYGRSKVVTSCVTEPREQDCGYKHLFYGSFHHSEDYRVEVHSSSQRNGLFSKTTVWPPLSEYDHRSTGPS